MAVNHVVNLSEGEISVGVTFAPRKTMEISVLPSGQVTVRAPDGASWEQIDEKLSLRERWILKQQRYFQQFGPRTPPRTYVGGETHLYLGRRYRLKVVQGLKQSVIIMGGYLQITSHYPSRNDLVQELMDEWLLERARVKFPERVAACFSPFAKRGYSEPPIIIRQLSNRWGSMSPAGRMTLNRDLIRAPVECIDYVIVHELCHLELKGHQANYYKLLEQIMPDWENRKQKLEHMLA